jgi:O-antigen/teichoic acid export membrane protein
VRKSEVDPPRQRWRRQAYAVAVTELAEAPTAAPDETASPAPSPIARYRETIVGLTRDLGPFGAGTITYQAGRLALNLVAAGLLGPRAFGAWVLIGLVLVYGTSISLGVTNGAGREIPFELGAGKPDRASRAEDVAVLVTIVTGVCAAGVAVIIGPSLLGDTTGDPFVVAVALGGALFMQQLFLLQQVLLRSRFRFTQAAAQLAFAGVAILTLGLILVHVGIVGLAVGQGAALVVVVAAGLPLQGRVPRPAWDPTIARRLVSVGLPIMLAGLAFSLLTTIDRWLVLGFLGREAVGVYGLVGLMMSSVLLLPTIVSQQLYPRIAFAHGEGRSGRELLALARRQGAIAFGLTAVVVVPIGAATAITVGLFLHAYRDALAPLTIVLGGLLTYSFSSGYGNLLNTIGAQRTYLGTQLMAIAYDVVLAVVLLSAGFGLVGAATSTATSMALYSLLLRWRAHQAIDRLVSRNAQAIGADRGSEFDTPRPPTAGG